MPSNTLSCKANIRGYRRDVIDTFTRADSATSLGTSNTGQAWAPETGGGQTWGISANRAYIVAGGASDAGATLIHGETDGYIVEADFLLDPATSLGLIWRSNGIVTPGGQKFWVRLLFLSGTYRMVVQRQIGAATVTLYDQPTVVGLAHYQTVRLRVQVIGNLFRFWMDDVFQTELTDANHTANTRGGIIIANNSFSGVDNFQVREWGAEQTLSMQASIENTVTRTLSMKAAVDQTVTQTLQMKATITAQNLRRIDIKAAIQSQILFLETAGDIMTVALPTFIVHEGAQEFGVQRVTSEAVYIWELDTQFQSNRSNVLSLKANLFNVTARTLEMRATLTDREQVFLQMRAYLRPTFRKQIQMRAKIVGPQTRSLTMKAQIHNTFTNTLSMKANLRRANFQLQMKASIRLTGAFAPTQQISMKASITPQQTQKISLKASISQTVQNTLSMKCRILPLTQLSMRASLFGLAEATLEVTYNVLDTITTRLAIRYNANDMVRETTFLSMQARIHVTAEANLGVTYSVDYAMPTDCQQRPTQRVEEE